MIQEFEVVEKDLKDLSREWIQKLLSLSDDIISGRRNKQGRTIKQILGHMIDSASNNTHRIVHLQYQESPFRFPNYASNGNNDRWIAIQNWQGENWENMVSLWQYSNLHYIHVVRNVNPSKLNQQWFCSEEKLISLKEMVVDYVRHFKLHLDEIDELINTELS